MVPNQRIQRRHRHRDGFVPTLSFPAGRALRGFDEVARGGRDGRIVDIDLQRNLTRFGTDRDRFDRNRRVAYVDQSQDLHQCRVRLTGDHTCVETAEGCDAIADMRADIEHEVAWLHESAIQPVHRRPIVLAAVIDAQGADDTERSAERRQHVTPRAAPRPRSPAARADAGRQAAHSPLAVHRSRRASASGRPKAMT